MLTRASSMEGCVTAVPGRPPRPQPRFPCRPGAGARYGCAASYGGRRSSPRRPPCSRGAASTVCPSTTSGRPSACQAPGSTGTSPARRPCCRRCCSTSASGCSTRAGATDAPAALDALLRWHASFALSQPDLITVQNRELANVPEPARRQIRRLQRLYVEEWVTVLSELSPRAPQASLRTAVHATFGLLNSTPHSAAELDPEAMADLLCGMGRAALAAAAE